MINTVYDSCYIVTVNDLALLNLKFFKWKVITKPDYCSHITEKDSKYNYINNFSF